jgi:streptogramin lyase
MATRFLWIWLAFTVCASPPAFARNSITGLVKDATGTTLHGVFVSAKRDGSVATTTVYSDDAGKFRFPELAEGMYVVTAHAGGFQSSERSNVAVKAGRVTKLVFMLAVETRPAELVKQSTASEWLTSLPGTMEQKLSLAKNCDGCHHNVYQLRDYRFTEEDWTKIISAMERIDVIGETPGRSAPRWVHGSKDDIAAYLAEVQGPDIVLPKIRFSPRPTGKATRAVITEYRIPRANAVPHDVYVDAQGNAWYNDFKADYLGKLNPQTGEFKEYKLPSKAGVHPGSEEIFIDPDQNIWIGERLAKRFVRFDPRKEEVTGIYENAKFVRVDAQRGVALGVENQMDLKTGEIKRYRYKSSIASYGNGYAIDANGIGYMPGWTHESVIRMLNPETGDVTNFPTPTPDAAPRRLSLGADNNIWFGEWYGGKIGKLDLQTKKITEYDVPDPFAVIYQANMDPKNHTVWSYDWISDREIQLDPKTGEMIEYPMPTLDVESRRTAFDPAASTPTMWIHDAGNGALIRIQIP